MSLKNRVRDSIIRGFIKAIGGEWVCGECGKTGDESDKTILEHYQEEHRWPPEQ